MPNCYTKVGELPNGWRTLERLLKDYTKVGEVAEGLHDGGRGCQGLYEEGRGC